MPSIIHLTLIIFLIFNVCSANIHHNLKTKTISYEHNQQCRSVGEICHRNSQCCSQLSCSVLKGKSRCLPSINEFESKRQSDDLILPPYYQQSAREQDPASIHGKKQEWDHCQYHEDCGEGNCCYVHFRFRSLPKWFCRPNRKDVSEPCEPLDKYQSMKHLPGNVKEEMKSPEAIEHD